MPRRNLVFADNEIYHIYNHSIADEEIFISLRNLKKALEIIDFYRLSQKIRLSKFKTLPEELKLDYSNYIKSLDTLVEIYAFSFMPNHFHFMLRQIETNGIKKFIANFQNSYAKVYNLIKERSGGLFISPFKAKRIENDAHAIHLSRYIHLNPVTSYLIEIDKLDTYPWTSFPFYTEENKSLLVNTDFIIKLAGSKENYIGFVANQVDYQRKLTLIKNKLFD